jgi:hypothetical protein
MSHQPRGRGYAQVAQLGGAEPHPNVDLPSEEEKLEVDGNILVWDYLAEAHLLHRG